MLNKEPKKHSLVNGKMAVMGMTQKELAKAINMSTGTLNLKLNGKAEFTTGEIRSICEILGIKKESITLYFFG